MLQTKFWVMKYIAQLSHAILVLQSNNVLVNRFEEAVKHYTINVSGHMRTIKEELENQENPEDADAPSRKEELLEELLEIVENIDHAKGRLGPVSFPKESLFSGSCTA